MQHLSIERYQNWRQGAQLLEADSHGDKVLRLSDGTFLKLFRLKRLFSSALFRPYAQRFADNATRLQGLGVPCPSVIGLYRMTTPRRDLVHYAPLPGITLRELRDHPVQQPGDLPERLGRFIAELHQQGIYFRSLHLGNIVLTPSTALGLIDIADLKLQNYPLRINQRKRNLKHLTRNANDLAWLRQDGRMMQAYRVATGNSFSVPDLE
ncbi:lipopolysaccharide kinase InaA family protein [Ectopseudomonas alcaliphila]|uniref:lipopolysaccharide kinase InaA family protein n=1 Tax=Ectopseudomonas alcaliphila TaxID=101564 RepID=UPI00277D7D39|nr:MULTISPECIES: phosphotransferase [Pseudomonas]MDP9938461.1 tRNA A-37 threonylcarbamoyl transferase component Bud32 [Pseudomonas sp. 3400]MDR7010684.1 tRNA A-37 threonylcarbamoyl transferase component Bud32 [Pseudomonas alcaliphila]